MATKIAYFFFFYKNKRFSFIEIDRVHQYNTNSKSYFKQL